MSEIQERKLPNKEKLCILCGQNRRDGQRPHCWTCGLTNHIYRKSGTGQLDAHKAVLLAVKQGRMAPPTDFVCVDCEKPAEAYEHRDYNHPLDVQPVCRVCNRKRGNAIPKNMTYAEFMEAAERHPGFRRFLTRADFEPLRRKYWPDEQ
jgi:hypothetical protein